MRSNRRRLCGKVAEAKGLQTKAGDKRERGRERVRLKGILTCAGAEDALCKRLEDDEEKD